MDANQILSQYTGLKGNQDQVVKNSLEEQRKRLNERIVQRSKCFE